ncbi:CheR family methyltransferase [Sulfurimonas sp.]
MFSIFKKKTKVTRIEKLEQKQVPNFIDSEAKDILFKIQQEFGLDYAKQEYITLRKIERFAIKNEIFNFRELHKLIQTSEQMKEKLLNMLTVGETYFYRELGHFKILASIMEKKKIKKILCAPSSSGEEIYSILLFLQEYFHTLVEIHITGIDINSEAIGLAKEGIYSKRSVSQLPLDILQNNFTQKDSYYSINENIKRHASFLRENIFDLSKLQALGKFEVVFCRNMLIYFNEAQKKEALLNIRILLEDDGILFLGHADISFEPEGFRKIVSPQGSYFKKEKSYIPK